MIVFDLDDTLIDTSGAVVPFKMKLCLERLKQLGLELSDFSTAYQRLLEMNSRSL
ncbi:MAG: haloacid dehalogenase, partial [Chlamydiae bacterium]|nr:haloacid dehalogenase [Chlamydiota bacterium]